MSCKTHNKHETIISESEVAYGAPTVSFGTNFDALWRKTCTYSLQNVNKPSTAMQCFPGVKHGI